jgi:hypothetical protein
MNDDLSDEAFVEWIRRSNPPPDSDPMEWVKFSWTECRCRALEMLEEQERKAFEAGIKAMGNEDDYPLPIKSWVDSAWRAYQAEQREAK